MTAPTTFPPSTIGQEALSDTSGASTPSLVVADDTPSPPSARITIGSDDSAPPTRSTSSPLATTCPLLSTTTRLLAFLVSINDCASVAILGLSLSKSAPFKLASVANTFASLNSSESLVSSDSSSTETLLANCLAISPWILRTNSPGNTPVVNTNTTSTVSE